MQDEHRAQDLVARGHEGECWYTAPAGEQHVRDTRVLRTRACAFCRLALWRWAQGWHESLDELAARLDAYSKIVLAPPLDLTPTMRHWLHRGARDIESHGHSDFYLPGGTAEALVRRDLVRPVKDADQEESWTSFEFTPRGRAWLAVCPPPRTWKADEQRE